MSGFNPNENNYFGSNYVNFDQFLMQHNIVGQQAQYFHPQPIGLSFDQNIIQQSFAPQSNVNTFDDSPVQPQQQQQNGQFYNNDLVQNSNLVPTAEEFIPQQSTQISNTNLVATATEFIPNNALNINGHFTPPGFQSVNSHLPTMNKVNAFQLLSMDNNNPVWTESTNVEAGSDKPPTQLNSTDTVKSANSRPDNGETTCSSGAPSIGTNGASNSSGAIKKLRNNQNRDSKRNNHESQGGASGGSGNSRNNHRERGGGAYDNHNSKENRRQEKNYENRRFGTGRTASQYDNSDRYNNKNEYFSDKYSADDKVSPPSHSNHNRWNSNSHSNNHHHNNGENEHNPKFGNRGQKDKRNSDHYSNKKSDDYKNRNSKSGLSKFDFTNFSQREKLIREIESGKMECLVCCELIKPFQSTWPCPNCFHVMHLSCVIKWAASSKSNEGWRCCACQNVNKSIPHDYFCFCGKTKNPQYNRNDLAHSCGELCGRTDGCEHRCTQLCHPGPCPSCHATVTRTCGCGRTSKTMQCCQKDDLECDNICDKLLNCGAHNCSIKCHVGECTPCDKEVEHKCYCGRDTRNVSCTKANNEETNFSCEKTCNKLLDCKNHKCKEKCHAGSCTSCKLLPEKITNCPCGKLVIEKGQRESCKDPIPLCSGVCNKTLSCGQPSNPHVCITKCHIGQCPPCNKQTTVKCRCGHMDQKMKCTQLSTRADDARCKKRCTKKRNCGRHKCNQECCIDIDHICPMPCNFTLSCHKHKCDQMCHKGRCLPCYRSSFEELYCECGANVIFPPVPCGTKKPECDKPCPRSHPCDHPVTHNCHSTATCPPCMAFTTKFCHGRHEQRKIIPCSQDSFSCGLSCNKPLKCGQHKCIKICHAGPCEIESDVCKQNCTKPRVMCSHHCNAPCHLDRECPDLPCRENVEVLCQCGLRKMFRTCHDFSSDYRKIATAKFASSMQDMQRGTTVELSDVLGPIKLSNNKTLECNEECKMQERNRKLAIGLQIRNPDLSSKLQPKYSEFIRNWGKKDPKLVEMIHEKLTELVKLAKDSRQKTRSHSFPSMNREKRQLVHEMCAMFGVESVAYDAEPNRNVVASATRETSWLPSMSVMDVVQRESGQRRIPVPSLNAWGLNRR